MNTYSKLIISIIVCELAGIAATPFTIAAIPTWYATLIKPPLSPPNFLFGPVWTILYLLMGISVYMVWEKGIHKPKIKYAVQLFIVQLGLNFLWSVVFFGLRSPLLALLDIILLLIAISITIIRFHTISKVASYLLVPYLVWVSFATYLNFSIWILNK